MKQIFIFTMILAGILTSCGKNDDDSTQTNSAGTYTIKATVTGGGVLYGATIYIDTELSNETRDYSVLTDDHVRSMVVGRTEWEGSYDIKKSIKVQINARTITGNALTENSVLRVAIFKDEREITAHEQKGTGDIDGLVAYTNIILP